MVVLDEKLLVGKYKEAFLVESRNERENPVKVLFSLMLDYNLIDGILTASRNGNTPRLILKSSELEIPERNACFGINSLLKKAIQKYRLSKLAVFGPACTFDGLNKTQYFGIGCNWTKTAIALKVSFLCPGILTERGFQAEVTDILGKTEKVERFFFENGELYYRFKNKSKIKIPPDTHHSYIISPCRYCLNLSGKGTDLTCVYLSKDNRTTIIVRSERGLSLLAQVQKKSPQSLIFKRISNEKFADFFHFLKEKFMLNAADIIERVELGLPVPKWNDNKLRRFYRVFNSIDVNFEEEVF